MMRMSLTQIAALYMDPKTASLIFPKTLNFFRWGGWLQAKYTQDGVRKVVHRFPKARSLLLGASLSIPLMSTMGI